MTETMSLNQEQQLYFLPRCDGRGRADGYSCLGFEVCREQTVGIAAWLGVELPQPLPFGSYAAYALYRDLCGKGEDRFHATGERCLIDLSPQLVGLEGQRVEAVTLYDSTRRFWVGKSGGWLPIHLEVPRRGSGGGMGAARQYASVRVVSPDRVR